MMERNARSSFIKVLPLLWLAILLMYSYAKIFQAPYPGFSWLPNGTIRDFYVATTQLELGDHITQIGAVRWEDYRTDWRVLIFENARPGEVVPVQI